MEQCFPQESATQKDGPEGRELLARTKAHQLCPLSVGGNEACLKSIDSNLQTSLQTGLCFVFTSIGASPVSKNKIWNSQRNSFIETLNIQALSQVDWGFGDGMRASDALRKLSVVGQIKCTVESSKVQKRPLQCLDNVYHRCYH